MRGLLMALFAFDFPGHERRARARVHPLHQNHGQNDHQNGLISLGLLALSPGPARGRGWRTR